MAGSILLWPSAAATTRVNILHTRSRERSKRSAVATEPRPSGSGPGWRFLAILLAFAAFAQTTRSVWDGVYTQAQAKRGEVLYAEQCASCHGLALNGGESAPPLTGGEFMSNWNTLTVGDLFDRIRSTMPANNPGHLTRDQAADIVAQILTVNQFPPGST